MRFLIVDDEKNMLERLREMLCDMRPEAEILSFSWPDDALDAVKSKEVDVAFLDIELGNMTGLELAAKLKIQNPDMHIIFVTGYPKYALDAFAVHATGYLLKPVDKASLKRELTFIYGDQKKAGRVRVQTFGGFEIFVDEIPVKFERTKAKELLAYLIDRRGTVATTGEAYAVLFEDTKSTVSKKSYFRTIVSEMKRALKEAGADEILEKGFNSLAIVPGKLDCDYYRFLQGDPIAVNQYRNDYMPSYSWAEFRNANLVETENKMFLKK